MRRIALLIAAGTLAVPAAAYSQTDDFEAQARAMYQLEPGYEKAWPVEFHIRVLEPLTQQVAATAYDLGTTLGAGQLADAVEWGWGVPGENRTEDAGVARGDWKIDSTRSLPRGQVVEAWRHYLAGFEYVDQAQLKIKVGEVPGPGAFAGTASFHVSGRGADGAIRNDSGKVALEFRKTKDGWRVSGVHVKSMNTVTRREKMFAPVSDAWLSGVPRETRRRLQKDSVSDDIHARMLSKAGLPEGSRLQPVAMDAHPGVVVVDIDDDRYDDLFVWDVLGAAALLHNVEGRTFEDATARFGCAFSNVSAASFADLNNDQVPDLVLGRWFEPSSIYFGERVSGGGLRFLPVSIPGLPAAVATISVADVDNNGRLDVFFGTSDHDYHARAVQQGTAGERADANVNQVGPPNVLLLNLGGGRWRNVTHDAGLDLERNTLEAAFADFNDDGWPDLFIGNDFAPGNLFENLGGHFHDISEKTGARDVFFGMGASWGDVDGDGDLDLYASAMSSSAGKRIMSDEAHFDASLSGSERMARHHAARGNTLLRNDHDVFTDLTETEPYSAARNGGWAYGAQLFDADNDGWLDIYVPNGFFTARSARRDDVFRDL